MVKEKKEEIKSIDEVIPAVQQLEGEQTKKEDILDKEIVIKDFTMIPSGYDPDREFPIIQATLGDKLITFTGGIAIKSQLERLTKEKLPVKAKIVANESKKGRKYYTLAGV